MKTPSFYAASILLTGLGLMVASCAKDDTTAPIITLNGNSEISIDLQQPYVELGATAIDDEDNLVLLFAVVIALLLWLYFPETTKGDAANIPPRVFSPMMVAFLLFFSA